MESYLNWLVDYTDEVWMNGKVIRRDYSTTLPRGKEILSELLSVFPNVVYDEINLIGKYDGYREPYKEPSISLYRYGKRPPLEEYGIEGVGLNRPLHYGLKYGLNSKEIILKILVKHLKTSIKLPKHSEVWCYSRTYSKEQEYNQSDIFIKTHHHYEVRKWCDEMGIEYPHSISMRPWCYGILFNRDTDKVVSIKGYIKYYARV